ncbi:hypothetical protein SUGI_0180600 [Cryptomeria japonica]|nr:hypothetical protein SUGI_0180600 [Cryptomeria japonica]
MAKSHLFNVVLYMDNGSWLKKHQRTNMNTYNRIAATRVQNWSSLAEADESNIDAPEGSLPGWNLGLAPELAPPSNLIEHKGIANVEDIC